MPSYITMSSLSVAQVASFVDDGKKQVYMESRLKSDEEVEQMMFYSYFRLLRMYTCSNYQLWGAFGSCELNQETSYGEEHETRYTIHLYHETMLDDVVKFCDQREIIRVPTGQEPKVSENITN